jgi:hypothetical protein
LRDSLATKDSSVIGRSLAVSKHRLERDVVIAEGEKASVATGLVGFAPM